MLKCPYCGSSHYMDCGGYTTAVCYPSIWEGGINVNPDRNRTTTTYRCLDCGKEFVTNGALIAIGNRNGIREPNTVGGISEYIKNETIAMGEAVEVKDANSILIKSDKLLIKGDCFETTFDLTPDKLEKFNKIIINGVTFIREK